jgi:hypothetical protein
VWPTIHARSATCRLRGHGRRSCRQLAIPPLDFSTIIANLLLFGITGDVPRARQTIAGPMIDAYDSDPTPCSGISNSGNRWVMRITFSTCLFGLMYFNSQSFFLADAQTWTRVPMPVLSTCTTLLKSTLMGFPSGRCADGRRELRPGIHVYFSGAVNDRFCWLSVNFHLQNRSSVCAHETPSSPQAHALYRSEAG